MKANRSAVHRDEAVSPVIATILMVAITVVLAATVYLFVSGFGAGNKVITASMAAKAVDLPTGLAGGPTADTDTSDDALDVTFTSGEADYPLAEVKITIDGVVLTNTGAPATNGLVNAATAMIWCTTLPGGDTTWGRGESLFLWKDTGGDNDRTGADAATMVGQHLLKVAVQNQVVLDTTVEVHDSLAA